VGEIWFSPGKKEKRQYLSFAAGFVADVERLPDVQALNKP
jgi:hypothetical protein